MKPTLTLLVEASCASCKRARAALLGCRELLDLAEVVVEDLTTLSGRLPDAFVGVPTTVLDGRVVALGTPDCEELVQLLRARAAMEGSQ